MATWVHICKPCDNGRCENCTNEQQCDCATAGHPNKRRSRRT